MAHDTLYEQYKFCDFDKLHANAVNCNLYDCDLNIVMRNVQRKDNGDS